MKDYPVTFNEDTHHFFIVRPAEEMTEQGLRHFVDQYADTSITRILFCANGRRAFYASDVWDRTWETPDSSADSSPFPELQLRYIQNSKILHAKGLDHLGIWLEQCKANGISGWLTTRMNDSHCSDDLDHFMHPPFWRDNPQYWRIPESDGHAWTERSFDFAHAAVRERHMTLLEEMFERYDFDGLELDWMRFGHHLRPGHEADDAHFLTEFTAQVRELADKWEKTRGHRIELSARVPARPSDSLDLGMDAVTWARDGLIDELVPSPFWVSADFTIPIPMWRMLLGEAAEHVRLSSCLDWRIMGCPGDSSVHLNNSPEIARAFAAAALEQGADIYLFNYMDRLLDGSEENLWEIYRDMGDREAIATKPRRHPVTFTDHVAIGTPMVHRLPIGVSSWCHQGVQIDIGPVPTSGKATFRVGLAQQANLADATFTSRANGTACEQIEDNEDLDQFPGSARVVQFDVPIDALTSGKNVLAIRMNEAAVDDEIQGVWAELLIDPR